MASPVSSFLLTLTFVLTLNELDVCSAEMACTESKFKWPAHIPSPRMTCVLLGSGDNLFDPKIMNDARKAEEIAALHITTEGRLILPSLAINETYLKEVIITAKKGIDLARGVFAGIQIKFLELNYDWYEPVIPGLQSNVLKLDDLSATILSIGGIKKIDLSAVRRIVVFNYMGSSDGLTIKWPADSVLDKLVQVNLKTDRFLPDFRKMRNLVILGIHSLSYELPPDTDQAKPVADLISNLQQMDLSAVTQLDLTECYTPDVIDLPFSQMPKLEQLNLENNMITTLPSEFGAGFGINGSLESISLDTNLIRAIPANCFNFNYHFGSLSIFNNPIVEIGTNAFGKMGYADISLTDNSNVSLQNFNGIEKLTIRLNGNASISAFQNETIEHTFERINIKCERYAWYAVSDSACAGICPELTTQICEVVQRFDIDTTLCGGKFSRFC